MQTWTVWHGKACTEKCPRTNESGFELSVMVGLRILRTAVPWALGRVLVVVIGIALVFLERCHPQPQSSP